MRLEGTQLGKGPISSHPANDDVVPYLRVRSLEVRYAPPGCFTLRSDTSCFFALHGGSGAYTRILQLELIQPCHLTHSRHSAPNSPVASPCPRGLRSALRAANGGSSFSHLLEHLALLYSRCARFLGHLAELLSGSARLLGGLANEFRGCATELRCLAAGLGSLAPCFGVATVTLSRRAVTLGIVARTLRLRAANPRIGAQLLTSLSLGRGIRSIRIFGGRDGEPRLKATIGDKEPGWQVTPSISGTA